MTRSMPPDNNQVGPEQVVNEFMHYCFDIRDLAYQSSTDSQDMEASVTKLQFVIKQALAAINKWHKQQCLREFLEIVGEDEPVPHEDIYIRQQTRNELRIELRATINAKYNHSEESGIVDNQVVTLDDLLTTPEEIAALPVVASGLQRDFRKGHGWDVERAKRSKQYQIGYHAGWMAAKRKYGGTDEKTN